MTRHTSAVTAHYSLHTGWSFKKIVWSMKCGMVNIVGSIKILFCILNSFVWNDFGISRSQDENGSWFHYLYISLEMEGQVKRIALWDTVLVCHNAYFDIRSLHAYRHQILLSMLVCYSKHTLCLWLLTKTETIKKSSGSANKIMKWKKNIYCIYYIYIV